MTAIEFENVSKQYRLGLVSTRTLSHDLNRWWQTSVLRREDPYLKIGETNDRASKGNSEYVWALRDINFKVEEGDVVGIIGKNGAGKSTLLKLLSRVTAPTTGHIRARGRIASLLEVGTGFHPEMTGRENIYLNGAILGMSKQEIDSKLDEIVDFSGCERYIDTPVKRYSSGMTVRLGFAVAAHLDPEILVVDEVLAVGDAEFQKKAIGKMQDISTGQGRTVLFVSHNMASMHALCQKGVLLENGMIKTIGEIDDVIEKYQIGFFHSAYTAILTRADRQGSGEIRLANTRITDINGNELSSVVVGHTFCIELILKNEKLQQKDINELSVAINDEFGQRNVIMNNLCIAKDIIIKEKWTTIRFTIEKCQINAGHYTLAFFLSDKFGVIDWIDNIATILIEEGDYYNSGYILHKGQGRFFANYTIQIID